MSERKPPANGLTVIRPGVQSSLQDLGRYSYAKQGLSQGGAMDLHAYCWVNKLLENPMHCPALEIVIGMADFLAESDLNLAITGADMQAEVDGVAIGNWCSFNMHQGQLLKFKPSRTGMRAYLAVAGGFSVSPTLGSVSTVVRNQLGGIDGGLIKTGDDLPAGPQELTDGVHVPHRFVSHYPDKIEVRVIESYQSDSFFNSEKEKFYRSEYTVSQDSDRMGARLAGPSIQIPLGGIISEGIALGAIQFPPDGQPIILLNDRQTLGGYPKLGCVAKVDLPKLAQARPGTVVRFTPISLSKAREQWWEFTRFFAW